MSDRELRINERIARAIENAAGFAALDIAPEGHRRLAAEVADTVRREAARIAREASPLTDEEAQELADFLYHSHLLETIDGQCCSVPDLALEIRNWRDGRPS